ncbi:MAG: TolC family protein [Deltaproteobacteria bacterium]|nr:TolC family protein [Deltaproteobacteria bacterium]
MLPLFLRPSAATALATVLGALLLGGCATFSPDGGFDAVESIAKERLNKEVTWIRSAADAGRVQERVKELLAGPLSVDDAVQVALLNNRGLQAVYSDLGISEANLVQAGRLRNPGFSYSRATGGGERKIESLVTFDFLQLLTMPTVLKIEGRRFEQAKLYVANEVLGIGAETQRAYYETLAAEQTAAYLEQVKTAAEAGAELARRMAAAGNWSRLDQAREQVFYAEATARLARARQAAVSQRERLTRLLGLWGGDIAFKLPEHLPEIPAEKPELKDLEVLAISRRLDIRSARHETEALAESLGLTRATRFINVFELGDFRTTETPGPEKRGYAIILEVPLFDWGGARVAMAESMYMQAVNRLAETAIGARSEVRVAYSAYLTAYDLAKHYQDEIVPLRKKISEENLLRYNGMLISAFELLADAREQVASVNATIEALRSFWVADADLKMALAGAPSTGQAGHLMREPGPGGAAQLDPRRRSEKGGQR